MKHDCIFLILFHIESDGNGRGGNRATMFSVRISLQNSTIKDECRKNGALHSSPVLHHSSQTISQLTNFPSEAMRDESNETVRSRRKGFSTTPSLLPPWSCQCLLSFSLVLKNEMTKINFHMCPETRFSLTRSP